MHHQPRFGLTCRANCGTQIRPALFAGADDVRPGPDFDSHGYVAMRANRLDNTLGVGISRVKQFTQAGRNQSNAGKIHQCQELRLRAVDAVAPESCEVVRACGARIEHRGDTAGCTQRIRIQAEWRMRIGMHVQVDQARNDQLAAGIDHVVGLIIRKLVRQRRDPVARDRHLAGTTDSLRGVNNRAAANQNVALHG